MRRLSILGTNMKTVLNLLTMHILCLGASPSQNSDNILSYKSHQRDHLTDKRVSTRNIWLEENVRSGPRCSQKCKNDQSCMSFFYNKYTELCQGHSITLGADYNGTTSYTGNKYYVLEEGNGYIGDVCSDSDTCRVNHSECRRGACWCSPGYSFWPRAQSCNTTCTTYGSDFTEVYGFFLSGNNMNTHLNVSFDVCADKCLQTTDFICRTIEYGWNTKNCYLQTATKYDDPGNWFADHTDGAYAHYQRDCL